MLKLIYTIAGLLMFGLLQGQNTHEKFTFELRFGWIKGGEATYQTKDTLINKHHELHAELHGYTTGFAQMLYSVNDQFESILSYDELLPYFSTKNLMEQNYRYTEKVEFDHENGKAVSNRSGTHFVDNGICDISSLMYNLRFSGRLDHLNPNEIIEIPFWDTNEWYILKLKYTGIEKVKTRLGYFECIRLEPQQVSGRFFNKNNPVNIWITNDSIKLPVLMELNFSIGSVKCELVKT